MEGGQTVPEKEDVFEALTRFQQENRSGISSSSVSAASVCCCRSLETAKNRPKVSESRFVCVVEASVSLKLRAPQRLRRQETVLLQKPQLQAVSMAAAVIWSAPLLLLLLPANRRCGRRRSCWKPADFQMFGLLRRSVHICCKLVSPQEVASRDLVIEGGARWAGALRLIGCRRPRPVQPQQKVPKPALGIAVLAIPASKPCGQVFDLRSIISFSFLRRPPAVKVQPANLPPPSR